MTAAKLLTFEFMFHGSMALLLLAMPQWSVRIVGWPAAASSFWPRLLGAVLLGNALASLTTLAGWTHEGVSAGMGLAGQIAVNLAASFVLLSIAYLGPAHPTRRGAVVTTALAIALLALALLEVAFV